MLEKYRFILALIISVAIHGSAAAGDDAATCAPGASAITACTRSADPAHQHVVEGPLARAGEAPQGHRVALVIGNSAYESARPLSNPGRDAKAVAAALRQVGFQAVRLENDLSRERLIDALRAFAKEADSADWAVIYFAGHGIEFDGGNYLVPVDARLETDRDVQVHAVSVDLVLGAVAGAKKLRLVLLDACRDNPFPRKMGRTIGRGLAGLEPAAAAGTLVVYAAKHGDVALDGTGENSPFAAAFVNQLQKPGVEIRKLVGLLRDEVMEATGRRQQPFAYGSLPGRDDFYFVSR
jgi:uncharacterized caspase-like protein